MKQPNLERWVTQILATNEQEISCSDCLERLSEYVERALAQSKPDARMLAVEQHIGQCRVCREEYEILRDLVLLESSNAH